MTGPNLTLWLPTRKGVTWGGGPLYRMMIDTPFLPRAGDAVHVLHTDDDGWSCSVEVRNTFWDGDGRVHAELLEHVIDPPDTFHPHRRQTTWWTDRDGDLHTQLLASGWSIQ